MHASVGFDDLEYSPQLGFDIVLPRDWIRQLRGCLEVVQLLQDELHVLIPDR